jgi:hypothetical protein
MAYNKNSRQISKSNYKKNLRQISKIPKLTFKNHDETINFVRGLRQNVVFTEHRNGKMWKRYARFGYAIKEARFEDSGIGELIWNFELERMDRLHDLIIQYAKYGLDVFVQGICLDLSKSLDMQFKAIFGRSQPDTFDDIDVRFRMQNW